MDQREDQNQNQDEFTSCFRKPSEIIVPDSDLLEKFSSLDIGRVLESCMNCKKNIVGEDVYIYKGEIGFCSPECRQKKILWCEKGKGSSSSSSNGYGKAPSVEDTSGRRVRRRT